MGIPKQELEHETAVISQSSLMMLIEVRPFTDF